MKGGEEEEERSGPFCFPDKKSSALALAGKSPPSKGRYKRLGNEPTICAEATKQCVYDYLPFKQGTTSNFKNFFFLRSKMSN